MTENAIAKQVVDAAFGIRTTLGPGLLESVYDAVLAYELAQRGLRTVSQQAIPVVYGTIRIDIGFRAGLIVENRVIVEIKPDSLIGMTRPRLKTSLRPRTRSPAALQGQALRRLPFLLRSILDPGPRYGRRRCGPERRRTAFRRSGNGEECGQYAA